MTDDTHAEGSEATAVADSDPGSFLEDVPAGSHTVDDDAEPVADLPLRPCLEAVLMVVDEPVTAITLAQVLQRPTSAVEEGLAALAEEYRADDRGFELRAVAGGWRLYSAPRYASVVERFVLDGQQARLTQASLETLAVVAYRQPVSRVRVSAVRGVNVDGVMRTLVSRGLVEECGSEPDTGAHLYRTTSLFLERLGIDSLDDLPPLAPYLPDIETLEGDL